MFATSGQRYSARDFDTVALINMTVAFLPPSKWQPLDTGIVAAFKKRTGAVQVHYALDEADPTMAMSTAAKLNDSQTQRQII